MSADTVRLLETMGHKVAVREAMGSANTIARSPDGTLTGASDPSQRGMLAAGYLACEEVDLLELAGEVFDIAANPGLSATLAEKIDGREQAGSQSH
jgi:hypothetical protein